MLLKLPHAVYAEKQYPKPHCFLPNSKEHCLVMSQAVLKERQATSFSSIEQ